MAIPAWLFFSFWAIISLTFLKLGFNAFDRTDLSTSVSPAIIFLLKHFFAISVSHSSHYAFHFRPQLKVLPERYYFWALNPLIPLIYFGDNAKGMWHFIYCGVFNVVAIVKERKVTLLPEDHIGLETDFIVKLSMYFIDDDKKVLFPTWVMLISVYTSATYAAIIDDKMHLQTDLWTKQYKTTIESTVSTLYFFFSVKENSFIFKKIIYNNRKLVRFAVGMVGTVLFQHFFPLTSFNHVLAFLYLAVAWLGNLALLRPSGDLGIFNFLLGNVVVGCTLSQFGLRRTTWVAVGASVLLYGLRLKLETVTLVNRGENQSQVLVFGQADDTMIGSVLLYRDSNHV